jgi:6,7-dimethyl-8-ribityllumazine synthase
MTPPDLRICIIAADFNKEIVEDMLAAAEAEAKELGVEIASVLRVPGSYEMPLIADAEMARDTVDGLVVLAYIERGETLHGEIMGQVVQQALVQLQLQYKKPIGMGIIGPGATLEQARVRKESYARAAVRAMVANARLLRERRASS